MGTTYSQSGVDISEGNRAVDLMKASVKRTYNSSVLTDIGNFAGLFALDKDSYEQPVLVSGTDGVGTKLRIAQLMDKHDTIGIDAVAMCVNDVLVAGAKPLFFLDYIAVGRLVAERAAAIVSGVAEGCLQAGCALIGGETAEMPGFYAEDDYDIAGFVVGVADKKKLLTGDDVVSGDVVLSLPSSGIHSNGFSLARKVLLDDGGLPLDAYMDCLGDTLGDTLLTPTRIYVRDVQPLLDRSLIKAMAHITGGGLIENIPRVLPKNVDVVLDPALWPVPPIFSLMQKLGDISFDEMHRVFNMGVGLVIIASEPNAAQICRLNQEVMRIGKVCHGTGRVLFNRQER